MHSALGCCIRTIYCSSTRGEARRVESRRGCLSRHEARCPGCCLSPFAPSPSCPSLSTQFDCQKHVKGVVVVVVVIGLHLWGKKLETIESNSFARNHRRVKLRDNIVSCLSQCDPSESSCVLCTALYPVLPCPALGWSILSWTQPLVEMC